MANFFQQTQPEQAQQASQFSGPSLDEKIKSALKAGQWVVSIPWGANPRPKKDGGESKHLLMTQKGPIGFGQYGVFGSVRAEGFLVWMPEILEGGYPNIEKGSWIYPTSHRRGTDGDEPIQGAKISGLHKVFLGHWKQELLGAAEEYRALGLEAKAKQAEDTAKGFALEDVFGKQLNFSLPITVGELRALKATGQALATAKGGKTDRATMVHNLIIAVDFGYAEDGEYTLLVRQVLETQAPLMTIPSGSRQTLNQSNIWAALSSIEEDNAEDKVAILDSKVASLGSKQGKNKNKKQARKTLNRLAATLEIDRQMLEDYISSKSGRNGLVWGVENLSPTKEEILKWAAAAEGCGNPQESVKEGVEQEGLLPSKQTEAEEILDPEDLEVEV